MKNQKHNKASQQDMDARKFLRMINAGAPSQVALFAERVKRMGEQVGAKWELVTLDKNSILYEDVGANTYYMADIKRIGKRQVKIVNPRELRIVESQKPEQFKKSINCLIDAIQEDNSKKANDIFNGIALHKFRPKVIPENGYFTARDNITRHIRVANTILDNRNKPEIIRNISEALSDTVQIKRGRIVEATFNNAQIKFPITELTRRRVVARQMKDVANKAYLSEGFQNRVKHIASLVCEEKLEDAVKNAAMFLKEQQEFCLLNREETQELIANTLAAVGNFNRHLTEDLSKLFYRTNCVINKKEIIEEWKITARTTEYAPFVENVLKLQESKNFESDYDTFLDVVFNEDMTTKVAKAKMYLNAIKDMKNILANSNSELAESLDEYIVRLERFGDEVDDATLMEVEELVASTSEALLHDVNSLSDFDTIPEPEDDPAQFGDADLGGAEGVDEDINAGGGLDLPLGGDDEDEEVPGLATPGEEDEEFPPMESKRTGKSISEASNGVKTTCECGSVMEDGACPDCDADEGLKEAVKKLNNEHLQAELNEWVKNGVEYFAKDGAGRCMKVLSALAEHADTIKQHDIASGFRGVLAENMEIDLSEIDLHTDPYAYKENAGELNHDYGIKETHETWAKGMKKSKEGGQIGGNESAKGDAMGNQSEPTDMNVSKDGHKGAILKKGSKASSVKEGISCPECNGKTMLNEAMTDDGALCAHCGADISEEMLAALNEEDASMQDQEGSGVVKSKTETSNGRSAGGSKECMDGQDGKGVAGKSSTKSNGSSAGGSKECMDGQDGKGVAKKDAAEKDAESVDEDQYKDATRRRRMAFPNKGRSSVNPTEDKKKKKATIGEATVTVTDDDTGGGVSKTVSWETDEPVDDLVSRIAASIENEMTDFDDEGLDDLGGGDEGLDDLGGDENLDDLGDDENLDDLGDDEGLNDLGGDDDGISADDFKDVDDDGEAGLPPDVDVDDEDDLDDDSEETPFGGAGEGGDLESDEGDDEDYSEPDDNEELEEGKLPDFIKKKMAEKNGEKSDEDDSEEDDSEEDDSEEDASQMSEDKDIGAPTSEKYTSEKESRKDGDGKQMNPKPKFDTKDYNGTGNAKVARPLGGGKK